MIPVTSLSSYLYCPRKLYIEKVLQVITTNRAALVKGSLHHGCLEQLNVSEQQLVCATNDDTDYQFFVHMFLEKTKSIVTQEYQKWSDLAKLAGLDPTITVRDLFHVMHGEARQRARDIYSFSEINGNIKGQLLWQKLTPKRLSEQKIEARHINMHGIIDCILRYDNGEFVPIEYKTGKAPKTGVWPGHKIQVTAYAVLLEHHFAVKVNKGVVRYLEACKEEVVHINPMLKDEVLELIREVQATLESPVAPPILTTPTKCASCALKEKCYDQTFMNDRTTLANEARKKGEKLEKLTL